MIGSYHIYVFLIFCVWGYSNAFFASDVNKYLSKRYGSQFGSKGMRYGGGVKGSKKGITKTHSSSQTQQSANLFGETVAPAYEGGCTAPPEKPANGKLRCSFYSGCSLSCERGYKLPGDAYAVYIQCENGKWVAQDTESEEIPSCQPECSPACQNQGICIAPDQCNCSDQFSGPQCQFQNKPCMELPPAPQNSKRTCRKEQEYCTVSCLDGHKFPDGSAVATLTCKNGQWVPGRDDWVSIPDCQATCSQPCQNGGICLSLDVCQCPQNFRGPQCQYSVDACTSSKLNFNGGLKCSGDSEKFVCSGLYCAEGMKISRDPAPSYTCKYSEGVFYPTDVPTCTFESEGMSLTLKVSSSNTSQKLVQADSAEYDYESSSKEAASVVIENKLPAPGVCYTWGGVHYKTFDGRIYNVDSRCAYTLVKDSADNTFSITVENDDSCYTNDSKCSRIINFYVQGRDYKLNLTDDGNPMLTQGESVLPIPGQAVGIRTETTARYINVLLDSVGVSLKWDTQTLIEVDTKESLWNRTEGLCGNIDGNSDNDIITKSGRLTKNVETAASSWQVDDVGVHCSSSALEKPACPGSGVKGSLSSKAREFCTQLLSDSRFLSCNTVLDRSLLIQACALDYCNCKSEDKSDCACDTMSVYVSECKHKGLTNLTNWRDTNTCPLKCSGGKVYQSCGPSKGQPVCGSSETSPVVDTKTCEEGCFCPEGKVLHNNVCIPVSKCPCRLRKKEFPAGSSVPKDCNTCVCQNGHWVCTQISCGARCSAIGDPHYTTFDGKKFDFMGKCSYYLIQGSDFSIETENVACPGAISELMSFAKTSTSEMPSCTKTATIKLNETITIKLRQNNDVLVNGQEITKLPFESSGITIRTISSIFLLVELPNGLEIWWDGTSRIYVDIPASFKEQTKGLCGTFNSNQKDDFSTPEGDVEQSVISFANKWKTLEACANVPNTVSSHPCDVNMHRKTNAEKLCGKIKSTLFSDCQFYVDPEQYYQDCLYDVCSCQGDLNKCLCTIIASYSHECASKGIVVDWRSDVKECGIQCPAGQKYLVCGDSCTRSCYDISTRKSCRKQCVEGCNCPDGEALDDNGECIPVGQCRCYANGIVFNPGYKEIRRIDKAPDLCSCVNGGWSCAKASSADIKLYPDAADLKSMCNSSLHLQFTSCEPSESKTCKNMDSYQRSSSAVCQPGCECKSDYVLDPVTKECIKPSDCPCHHGGKSYKENDVVQNDCNTCNCKAGKWSCTDRQCAAECSAWGDSHYKTFDGKHYDYQGQCDYVLAKGSYGDSVSFDISIQNVPCGSLGTSCSKSISIRVGSGNSTETITLNVGKPLPKSTSFSHLTVREIGLYVIVEAPDMGLTVRWDRGTRVYVRLNPKWKNQVKGLCGNYNDNQMDDFQTLSGGVTEVSPYAFGDSWKLEPYCPEAKEITDTCKEKPERRTWAMRKCGILKSSVFTACHSEVPIDNFYDKCLFDTCACDQGGDCECLCTALAAYAQECNNRGVPIHWRSQDLCPIQCDEKCSTYKPCISTCLIETCDNIYTRGKISATCSEDTCVEGCEVKTCPAGQVYLNSSFDRCVPVNECKSVCMEINGVTYYEGDILEEDSCHTCSCSRGQKICKGKPCTQMPISTTTPASEDETVRCVTGWSEWINQNPLPVKGGVTKRPKEVEPVPTALILNNLISGGKCSPDKMTDIRCRTVSGRISAKETGLDAECSLESGLICKSKRKGAGCPDFEIQVYCQCGTTSTITSTTTTTRRPDTTATSSIYITGQPQCTIETRKKAHEEDCYKYYVCQNGANGAEYVEQSCGRAMMFNPTTLSCDIIETVAFIRPECALSTTTREQTTATAYITVTVKPQCNSDMPNKLHESDCQKYYACENGPNGPEYVEQTCKGTMMYNPNTFGCDRSNVVSSIRPECALTTTTITIVNPEETTASDVFVITGKPSCNSETPNKPHENDCHKYYVCNDGPNGAEYVEQSCGSAMMYNPKTLSCDRIETVSSIRPECALSTTSTTVATTTRKPTTSISYNTITEQPHCTSDMKNHQHASDCHKYYACENGPNGPEYVIQVCGGNMMYNPKTYGCDRSDVVSAIRPECVASTTSTAKPDETTGTDVFVITGKPSCNSETPNKPFENDCHKYYVCNDGPNGAEYVVQTCGSTMMYNPKTLSCDRIEEVSAIRPECAVSTSSTVTPSTTEISFITITAQPECNLQTPDKPHESDCHKFYMCRNGPKGPEYVEQTCGTSLMFNSKTLSCDRIAVVSIIRPECAPSTTTTTGTTTVKKLTTAIEYVTVTAQPQCNSEMTNKQRENDCHKYYVCENTSDGPEYVEKICTGTMMYNPKTFGCDRQDVVAGIRPECVSTTTTSTSTPAITTAETTTTSTSKPAKTTATDVFVITGKPTCNSETPNKPHESDCYKYYVCNDGPNGVEYIEQSCGSTMMYNPKTLSCDRIETVSYIRPECVLSTTSTTITITSRKPTTSSSNRIDTEQPHCTSDMNNYQDASDCHKYYACENGPNGPEYVVQVCRGNMMYNPKTYGCDRSDVVSGIRPECVASTTSTAKPDETTGTDVFVITGKPSCNSETPNKPFENDCHKYYVCNDGPNGAEYVVQTCGSTMMYNPKTLSCDRIEEMSAIRPECALSTTSTTVTTTTRKPTTSISYNTITEQPHCTSDMKNHQHASDCHKYYACENGPNGPEYVIQVCGGNMMYNPKTYGCDRSDVVSAIRPECVASTTSTAKPDETTGTDVFVITGKPSCNSETPNKPFENDCHKYYVCNDGPNGAEYVVQTCGSTMMYNPKTLSCDRIEEVSAIRPECEISTSTVTTRKQTTLSPTTTSVYITGHPECNSQTLNRPDKDDCRKFYTCENGPNGAEYVEQTCEGTMLYNPKTFSCDTVEVVRTIRPECDTRCQRGLRYSDCAVDCRELCLFYDYTLRSNGICLSDYCEPGCVEEETFNLEVSQKCTGPRKWASNNTCVDINDCMCVSYDGKPVKPGALHKESDCKVCQCIQNYYVCDESACTLKPKHTTTTLTYSKPTTVVENQTSGTAKQTSGTTKQTPSTAKQTSATTKQTSATTKHTSATTKQTSGTTKQSPETSVKQTTSGAKTTSVTKVQTMKVTTGGIDSTSSTQAQKYTTPYVVVVNTETPPPECLFNFIPLVISNNLPIDLFSASSSRDDETQPKEAIINNKVGSWSPSSSDAQPFLLIDLQKDEPVYGIILKGNPKKDEYVTSYNVLYSKDGVVFLPINTPELTVQTFRGPIDNNIPSSQSFDVPVEARYIKIVPLTWHQDISMRADVLGCGHLTTTSTTVSSTYISTQVPTTSAPPICTDEMGTSSHPLSDEQITVSSWKDVEHDKSAVIISKPSSWQPVVDSTTEWVEFNFLEPRNLTGFYTKGGDDGWVEAFRVKVSNDGKQWNPILDKNSREYIFPANYDKDSKVTNYFSLPVQAQYIRLYPVKWHDKIQVKAEILGCYKPYTTTSTVTTVGTTTTARTTKAETTQHTVTSAQESTSAPCNYCPGVPSTTIELEACVCSENLYWNGTNCVTRPLCPCVVGSLTYPVGKLFNKEDCSECICKIGGTVDCSPKVCGKCDKGLKSSITTTCACVCQPCQPDERLCPTSNNCIKYTLWCDGVIHCPDDEIDCETTGTATVLPMRKTTPAEQKVCPEVICPPGFNKIPVRAKKTAYASSRYSSVKGRRRGVKGVKGGVKRARRSGTKGGLRTANLKLQSPTSNFQECVQYKCVAPPPPYQNTTEECTKEDCPVGYQKSEEEMVTVGDKQCPMLVCIPVPVPDSICNITGRTFVTFDGTEYKYDICDHVVARDLEHKDWAIILSKNCTETCNRDLHVYTVGDHFVFHSDLTVEYNNRVYTMDQLKKIGKDSNEFTISKVGNVIAFTSLAHGFWIEWSSDGNVKMGVVHSLTSKVDGLCGYFDNNINNDKRKPNGDLAKTTSEFGDSWSAVNETRAACKINTCPSDIQNKAWQLCNTVRDSYLSSCSNVVDLDASVSRCLDTACECLLTSTKENVTNIGRCKCQLLQSFVVDCLTANPDVEISGWRGQYDCPSNCQSPLQYKDCFQRECEPSCESLSDPTLCPKVEHACYPGCYCPAELVRKGDKCIKPSECRDCECKVTGPLDFLTYDESNFTVAGNCVYVLTRDVINDKQNEHNFQVLITNGPCAKGNKTCIKKVTVLYGTHTIDVLADSVNNVIEIIVDSEQLKVDDYSRFSDWIKIKQNAKEGLSLLLLADQVEVNIEYPALGVTVRAPSYKYGGKLEGLCGDCNRNLDDDLRLPNGTITEDVEEFSLSWLFDGLPEKQTVEQCKVKPIEECKPLPDSQNPCIHLLDENVFGDCYPVVDYSIYQLWCNKETCVKEGETTDLTAVCPIIESYAKECAREGICVNWHFDMCPQAQCADDKVFSACGSTCPSTCESINVKESTCVSEIVEGCFCPEGKVLKGTVCVPETECIDCDADGHHPGDQWVKDLCTNCTCEGRSVLCQKKECPAIGTICEQGYNPQKVISEVKECCDKYTCVPEPTTPIPCSTPQPLVCGEDKVSKLSKKDDGCYQNICECIPKDQCKPIDSNTSVPLEDGYEKIIDESDCCAKVKLVCKPELCSAPPICQEFYELNTKKEENKCCPVYTCSPPQNKCIFQSSFIAAEKGGERARKDDEKQKYLKNPSETWSDGPCRECQCQKTQNGDYQPTCSQKQCPALEKSADYNDYELAPTWVYNQCCANFERTACKVKGKTYKLNDEWVEGENYCTVYKCANNTDGDIIKEVQVTKCDKNCTLGFEYELASPESQKCCGSCQPVACVINDTVRREDEEWVSPDYCIHYKCLKVDGTMQVQGKETTCSEISPETLKNYVVNFTKVEGECCDKTDIVACKVQDQVRQIGESWKSDDDVCKEYKCSKLDDSRLAITEYLTTCNTTCPSGYSYAPADHLSGECCGSCQQSSCVVDGIQREIGEQWKSDDFCTQFRCTSAEGSLQVEKRITKCTEIPASTLENYVVKSEKVPGRCCNKSEVVACKGNDNVYKAGDTWTVGTDYCKKYKCVTVDQGLAIAVTQTTCNTTCPVGYEYVESSPDDSTCCGECQQAACIVNGTVRQVGEKWVSSDYCHKFRCEKTNDALQIVTTNIECKPIAEETLKRFVVNSTHVPGKCCNHSEIVACRGNDRIYNIGDTWIEEDNYCLKFECVKANDKVSIREYVTQCNATCAAGFEYEPASKDERKCCGSCQQVQCVVDGKVWEIGQEWEGDDHCSKYKCSNISDVIQVETRKTVCQPPSIDTLKEFVIQEIPIDGECCPTYKEIACKSGNETYQIGTTWTTDDLCKNTTCTRNEQGQVVKKELIETCKEYCDQGYQYVSSTETCCGTCVEVACVFNGTLKQPGDNWSSVDGCTNYTCEKDGEHMIVSAHLDQCPNLSDCPQDHIYDDGCCKKCNATIENLVSCAIENIPLDDTVGLIKTENLQHGVCVNKEPITNLSQCVGSCESSTLFDIRLGKHTSVCTCCQALQYAKIPVAMVCDDGFKWDKQIEVPSVCSCNGCQGGSPQLAKMVSTKSGRKTAQYQTKTKRKSVKEAIPAPE